LIVDRRDDGRALFAHTSHAARRQPSTRDDRRAKSGQMMLLSNRLEQAGYGGVTPLRRPRGRGPREGPSALSVPLAPPMLVDCLPGRRLQPAICRLVSAIGPMLMATAGRSAIFRLRLSALAFGSQRLYEGINCGRTGAHPLIVLEIHVRLRPRLRRNLLY